jgi:hypothetical protein
MRKGTKVTWNWGKGEGSGKVKEIFKEKVTRTIKGSEITRNGTPEDPALLIVQDDGDEVIKLESELNHSKEAGK